MDHLVREETQRLLSNQMREAKLQRQIQVKLINRQKVIVFKYSYAKSVSYII